MARSLSFQGAVLEAKNLMKHQCNDPICASQLWKTKQESDLAKLQVQQLQKEMEQLARCCNQYNSVQRPYWTYSTPSISGATRDLLRPRDMTHNNVTTNDPSTQLCQAVNQKDRRLKSGGQTSVSEIETVL